MSFIKITEQNSLYNDLERKSVRDLLEDINTEDQKVALAVRETIPKIEELVLQIVPRMKQGGRIFYLGAGTTPYVIGALRKAREQGILTASISSNPDSPMAMEADVAIEMIVGPEFVTGSSRMKSGTGQKMILNMISTSVMIRLGRVKGNRMVNMQLTNQKLIDRGTRMVAEELNLPYNQSRHLLLMYGSVQEAVEAYRKA